MRIDKLMEKAEKTLGKNSPAFSEIQNVQSFIKRYVQKVQNCREYKQEISKLKQENKTLSTKVTDLSKLLDSYKYRLSINGIDFNDIDSNLSEESEAEISAQKRKIKAEDDPEGNANLFNKKLITKQEIQKRKYKREYKAMEEYAFTLEKNLNFLRGYAPFSDLLKVEEYVTALNKGYINKNSEVTKLQSRVDKLKGIIEGLKQTIYKHIDKTLPKPDIIEDSEETLLENIQGATPYTTGIITKVAEKNRELKEKLKTIDVELEKLKKRLSIQP
eukprot:TRINITY_DN1708_c0_g1_i1.p3 TRINITY_DN1708_c0_g1~~TRINITY_DN1708_c0_g1_i1.p3  ORF type:complete len:274 (-),score=51.68 TRINITY_DN1708_c0_g1_i1:2321-3142(-)